MKLLFINPLEYACIGAKVVFEPLDLKLIGAVHDKDQALSLASTYQPDIIIIDAHYPTFLGFALAEKLRKISPCSKFIFNIAFPVRLLTAFLLDFGAHGIITRDTKCEEYQKIIQQVGQDKRYFDRNIQHIIDDIYIRQYLTGHELHLKSILSLTELELMAYSSSPNDYLYVNNIDIIALLKEYEIESLIYLLRDKFNVHSTKELKGIFKNIVINTTIESFYFKHPQ